MIEIKQLPKKDIIKVRRLIEDLLTYESKSFDDNIRIDKKGLLANFKFISEEFRKHKGALFVAVENSKIIGYTFGWIEIKPKDINKVREVGYFSDLFVEEKYRNKGIGGNLARALINWFRKNKITLVNIYSYIQNPSIKLYKRLGFKDKSVTLRMRLK